MSLIWVEVFANKAKPGIQLMSSGIHNLNSNQIDVWKKTEDALKKVVRILSPTFLRSGSQDDIDSILELLDNNELGEGYECLIALLIDFNIPLDEVASRLLQESGERMNIPSENPDLLLEQK